MSIFTKDCPVCGISQPSETVRCSCGHRFDSSASDGDTQDLKSIYHDERLYRDYLAARVDEAAKAGDKQTLEATRAELEAQEQRVLAMKKRLKLVRANKRKRIEAPASAKRAQPPPKPAVVAAPPVQSSRSAAKTRPTSPPVSVKPKLPVPTQPSAPTTATPRSNKGQQHTVRADARPVAPMQPARAATRPAPQPKAKPAAAKSSAQPAGAPPAPPGVPDKPAPSSQTGEAKECPNCSAKVPAGVARCGCGFEMLSDAGEMPSLPMSPEDRAAFLAAFGSTRKERKT